MLKEKTNKHQHCKNKENSYKTVLSITNVFSVDYAQYTHVQTPLFIVCNCFPVSYCRDRNQDVMAEIHIYCAR